MLVKLDDVVDRITGNEDRLVTKLLYYLGGEHYESESIAIYDKGLIKSEAGAKLGFKFHFPFRKGDTIFMSRNAHLKKAGMVMYDGICSDTSYVLRTKDERVLLPEYLPLVIQNDRFWKYFEENKSGSVNFLLNWREMKEYEFELPSIDEQKEISELAWAMEDTKRAYQRLITYTDKLKKAQFIHMFGSPLKNDKGWPTKKMKEVAPSITYSGDIQSTDGKYWLLNLDMIESNTGNIIEKAYVDKEEMGSSIGRFSRYYVLFSKLRPYLNKIATPDEAGYATTELVPLLPDQKYINRVYLANLLRGDEFLNYISSKVSGTKMPRVTMNIFWNFDVMLPPLELQNEFSEFVGDCDKSENEVMSAMENLASVYKRIIAERVSYGGQS